MQPIAVMGVSGSGKSTVASALAARLGLQLADGDSFHSDTAIARMSAGEALTDEDRVPWLAQVGAWLATHGDRAIVSCSALKRRYRDQLRAHQPTLVFVHLAGNEQTVAERIRMRTGHYMPESLISSQFHELEGLDSDEPGLTVDLALPLDEVVEVVSDWLAAN